MDKLANSNRVVKVDLSEKVTCKQRAEGHEEVRPYNTEQEWIV